MALDPDDPEQVQRVRDGVRRHHQDPDKRFLRGIRYALGTAKRHPDPDRITDALHHVREAERIMQEAG